MSVVAVIVLLPPVWVVSDIASKDPEAQALFSHIVNFRSSILRWTGVSEKEYLRARSLPFAYPSA